MVRAASLQYRGRALFQNLALDLAAGVCTCLLGPSGVGKSSLLKIIAGLVQEATAEVVDDRGTGLEGRVVFMAQQDLLLPWLSLIDNVCIGHRLRGGRRGDRQVIARARRTLADLGLAGRETLRPAELSGGMRQRAALARTLMEDRPIVLMDEPFSALDAITRNELQELAAVALKDRTVLLVTHDPLEALRLGHRILVMSGAPASLERIDVPVGSPPRPLAAAEIHDHHTRLLARLAAAKAVQP